jgi:Ca2+-binding EF-hand superfamily protein
MLNLLTGTLAAILLSAPAPDDQEKHKEHPATEHPFSFKALDLDGDGKITREEFMEAFAKLDRNHDGVLTPDELPGHESRAPQDKQTKQHPGKNNRKH